MPLPAASRQRARFDLIGIDDNVGILALRGRRYLAVDERLLYIPLNPRALARYGITRVEMEH